MTRNPNVWLALLVLIYLIGLIAIGVPLRPGFAHGLPWVLLLVWILVATFDHQRFPKLVLYSFLLGLLAWIAEFFNLQTGLLFGQSAFLTKKHLAIAGVPVCLIWVWALVTLLAGAASWIADFGKLVQVFFQSGLMLVIVYLIHETGAIWEFQSSAWDLHLLVGRWVVCLVLSGLFTQLIGRFDYLFGRNAYSITLVFLAAFIFIIS